MTTLFFAEELKTGNVVLLGGINTIAFILYAHCYETDVMLHVFVNNCVIKRSTHRKAIYNVI
jgi:hypothetical protein